MNPEKIEGAGLCVSVFGAKKTDTEKNTTYDKERHTDDRASLKRGGLMT